MNNVLGLILSYIFIAIIIVTAKFFEKFGKEASRKYIHIALCNWWFIAMCFFDNVIWASIAPLSFVVINYLSYKKNLIEVMEREKQEGLGTVYYAVALLILVIVSFGIINNPVVGLVGVLAMGYGDGLAAVVGTKLKSKEYKVGNTIKTLAGSGTMLIVTFIILSIFMVNIEFWFIKVILASAIITIIEALGIKGTDNLLVPLATSMLFYIFMYI